MQLQSAAVAPLRTTVGRVLRVRAGALRGRPYELPLQNYCEKVSAVKTTLPGDNFRG